MILQREKPSSKEASKPSNDSEAVVLKSISGVQVMLQLLDGDSQQSAERDAGDGKGIEAVAKTKPSSKSMEVQEKPQKPCREL